MIAFADALPLARLLPECLLVLALVLILAVDVLPAPLARRSGPWLGIAACLCGLLFARPADAGPVAAMLVVDPLTSLARTLLLPVVAVVLLAGAGEKKLADQPGAWSMAVVGLGFGAALAAAAANFLALWLGLEVIAMASYALVGLGSGAGGIARRPAEAGMKFVLFGGVSSAAMLFGISHVYGITGHFDFAGIGASLTAGAPASVLVALLLAGIGVAYKLTLVPFHFYAPDVYQGAPSLGIAAVSVVPKIGAATALVRFLATAVPAPAVSGTHLAALLACLAAVSALFAAFTAVVQKDGKRILAFSGIGHGASILLAAACGSGEGAKAAVVFYLLTYAAANVGAFLCLSVLERERGSCGLEALAGAREQRPWLVAALCLFVASLAGVPPLAGFLGKWGVLQQALARGLAADSSPMLGIAALLFLVATAIGAWGYLLIVRAVLLAPAPRTAANAGRMSPATWVALATCLLATFAGGVWLRGLSVLRDLL